jgi:hypothetical protein
MMPLGRASLPAAKVSSARNPTPKTVAPKAHRAMCAVRSYVRDRGDVERAVAEPHPSGEGSGDLVGGVRIAAPVDAEIDLLEPHDVGRAATEEHALRAPVRGGAEPVPGPARHVEGHDRHRAGVGRRTRRLRLGFGGKVARRAAGEADGEHRERAPERHAWHGSAA